jgi:hypothetical protein
MNHSFQPNDFHFDASVTKHASRHFHGSKKAGGTFLSHFQDISQILKLIAESKLIDKKTQGRMRSSFVFEYPQSIGHLGIVKRKDYPNVSVEEERRDDQTITFIHLPTLPETRLFSLICEWRKGRWNLITLYPGPSGEPFPHRQWGQDQNTRSRKFWDEYILVKIQPVPHAI